jgi:hypothetical protein
MKTKELTTASPIDKLVGRLDNAKHGGNGQWRAKCPVHQGENSKGRTLSVKETDTGSVLIKCFAGCTVDAVVSQLGLCLNDLFPPEKYTNYAKYVSKPAGKSMAYVRPRALANVYLLEIAINDLRKGKELSKDDLFDCAGAILRLKELHHE